MVYGKRIKDSGHKLKCVVQIELKKKKFPYEGSGRTYAEARWCLSLQFQALTGKSALQTYLTSDVDPFWAEGWNRDLLISFPAWIVLHLCDQIQK